MPPSSSTSPPGTRFPANHRAAEECYVLSGSLYTCNRRLAAGDFVPRMPTPITVSSGPTKAAASCSSFPPEDHLPEQLR